MINTTNRCFCTQASLHLFSLELPGFMPVAVHTRSCGPYQFIGGEVCRQVVNSVAFLGENSTGLAALTQVSACPTASGLGQQLLKL
jgi:hypothetical protein